MIGERLAELRKDKHLTQEELAALLTVSKYTISAYETEKSTPDDEIKVKMARIFDVSLDYLLGLIDVPVSYDRGKMVICVPDELPTEVKERISSYVTFTKQEYRRTQEDQRVGQLNKGKNKMHCL